MPYFFYYQSYFKLLQMTNILALMTILFLIFIIYLLNKIQSDRHKFRSKVKFLEDFIVQLGNEQQVQNNQLQLSEELKQKLAYINSTLNKEIYDLNLDLIEDLYLRK